MGEREISRCVTGRRGVSEISAKEERERCSGGGGWTGHITVGRGSPRVLRHGGGPRVLPHVHDTLRAVAQRATDVIVADVGREGREGRGGGGQGVVADILSAPY